MRLTQIENMLKDHEKRIKELETRSNEIPIELQEAFHEGKKKLAQKYKGPQQKEEPIAPINTQKGKEQRDKAREKLSEKAEEESKVENIITEDQKKNELK